MTKTIKYQAPTLNLSSFLARGVGALKALDGISLPADIVEDINQKVAHVEHVRAAEVKAPTFTDLANRLAAGGTVTAEDIAAEQAAERMREVQTKALNIALDVLSATVDGHRDDIIEAVAEQLATPAAAKLRDASHLAGADPGTLFSQGRDKDAKTLRDAVAAHAVLVRAYDIRKALGVNARDLGPCAAWQPHDTLNAPDLDEHGAVLNWTPKLTEKQARDFGLCMDLMSQGCWPWVPTRDQAAQVQGEEATKRNEAAVPARMPQNYRVNGRAASWSNASSR